LKTNFIQLGQIGVYKLYSTPRYNKEVINMLKNKLLMTALGIGATYLLRNKGARESLMNKIQSFTRGTRGNSAEKYSS
jgi:hypothetical protein